MPTWVRLKERASFGGVRAHLGAFEGKSFFWWGQVPTWVRLKGRGSKGAKKQGETSGPKGNVDPSMILTSKPFSLSILVPSILPIKPKVVSQLPVASPFPIRLPAAQWHGVSVCVGRDFH